MRSNGCRVAAAVRSSAASAAAAAPTRPVLVLAQSLGRAVDVLEASVHSSHGPFRSAPIAQGSRRGLKLPSDHVRGSSCCRRSKTKRVPARPISRGGSYRSASGRISPAAALCSLFARRHATLRPRRRKNKIPLAAPKRARAPPCPPPQPPPRERHAPQYPARRRYAPRARPQKCSRRTGETVTTKTTYAGSHRARMPQRPRPHDCVTAATAGEHLGNHHDPASYKRAPFVPP